MSLLVKYSNSNGKLNNNSSSMSFARSDIALKRISVAIVVGMLWKKIKENFAVSHKFHEFFEPVVVAMAI